MTQPATDPIAITKAIFHQAPFVADIGYELTRVEPGFVETRLTVKKRHCQHHGFVHAGVQATMADHSAGCAATTLLDPGQAVLTAEFKINLLRPAKGDALVCRARVLKPGRTLCVAESDVFAVSDGTETHVSRTVVTLSVVTIPEGG